MFAVIFGQPYCPFCLHLKDIAESLKEANDGFAFRYVDIVAEGLIRSELEKLAGTSINSFPQVFMDGKYLGGFDAFEDYAKAHLGLYQ